MSFLSFTHGLGTITRYPYSILTVLPFKPFSLQASYTNMRKCADLSSYLLASRDIASGIAIYVMWGTRRSDRLSSFHIYSSLSRRSLEHRLTHPHEGSIPPCTH